MRIVPSSREFQRILALPRRIWTPREAETLSEALTEAYRTPRGTMRLWPNQALMIAEAFNAGGGFFSAPVGSGKTIPSLLIPTVVEAERPILLIPAGLREKTLADKTEIARHFRIHGGLRLVNYELLQQPNSVDLLDRLRPDWILADEVQALKRLQAARTKRFFRYMRERPGVKFVAFTGSPTRTKLEDFAHLMALCLGQESPAPLVAAITEQWGLALNSRIEAFRRIRPGVLLQFCDGSEEGDETTRARVGYQKRLNETKGVLAFRESSCNEPLEINLRPTSSPPAVASALESLRATWQAPNGDELDSALELRRTARQLACGFYTIWDPPPPDYWLEARKKWHKFVRGVIARDTPGLDSPFLVAREYDTHPLHTRWVEVREDYIPEENTVAVWVDDWLCRDAVRWLESNRGIVWVEHLAVGERIAELSGRRFFAGGPRDARDIRLARGPYVASIQAHSKGRNLQHLSRNLLVSCPPSGDVLEQLIGRTHRAGQLRTVKVDTYLHEIELALGLTQAVEDAHYTKSTWGADQKLLQATWGFNLQEITEQWD